MIDSTTQLIPSLTDALPRILVVDDEPSICTIVRKTLSRDPYSIETTTRSLVALQRLEREPFDLLITDISMPDIDGLELAERARSAQALLGIVVMTGYGSFENMSRALRTGVADFIIKPFDIEDLRLTVARALERQRIQQDNIRLQTLVKVVEYGQAINSTLDPQELYGVVTDLVLRETGATALTIWATSGPDMLHLEHSSGMSDSLIAAAETLALQVLETDGTAAPRPVGQEHVLVEPPAHTDLAHLSERLVAMPLVASDERLGVLVAAYSGVLPKALDELLGLVGQQTALAMRNARQYATLRELDLLKSEFIGIASHELRTPLSLVLGYSSLLRTRLQGAERESLQRVIDGALRMGDIIDDLVNLRRSDLQELTLDLTPVDIWTLLREAVSELRPLADSRNVTLHLECPSAPLELDVDRDKLLLALVHLLDNALKFTEAGGVVAVAGHAPTLPNDQQVVIQVSDTGIGIAQRDLSRIFERFYQVAPSTTRTQNGLGLGLTLTKLFVELHGGRVQVQSSLGHGSIFQVRLPIRSPQV